MGEDTHILTYVNELWCDTCAHERAGRGLRARSDYRSLQQRLERPRRRRDRRAARAGDGLRKPHRWRDCRGRGGSRAHCSDLRELARSRFPRTAALASPIDYLRLPLHSLKAGSYGTHNALGLAKFKRARFLLASTSEVYGDPQVHPQPETYWGHVNPVGPRGVYDEAKRYAEAMTMAYYRQQGVDTSISRIFNTYGGRMRPNDGRAVPTFVRQALEGKPLTV